MKIISIEDSIKMIELYFEFLVNDFGYLTGKKVMNSNVRSVSYLNKKIEISVVYEVNDNYLEVYLRRLVNGKKPYGYSISYRILGDLEGLKKEQKSLYLRSQTKRDFDKMLEIAAEALKSHLHLAG